MLARNDAGRVGRSRGSPAGIGILSGDDRRIRDSRIEGLGHSVRIGGEDLSSKTEGYEDSQGDSLQRKRHCR
jgi:hypothetical protein